MRIYLNDEQIEIKEDTNLSSLVNSLGSKTSNRKGIAIAVDNQVVTRDLWEHYFLKENSKVVIITAAQGG